MRNVPRVVWVLAAARFVGSASSFLVLFLTLYLNGPRGVSITGAGLIAGSYGVGMLVGNFTGGRWGDRLGHRPVVLWTSAAAGFATVAIPWLPVPVLIGTLPVLAYLAATSAVSVGALSALAVDRGDRRTSVAIGRAASNAGFVLGPPMAAIVLSRSWSALFVIDGVVTMLLPAVLAPLLPRQPRTPRPAERPAGLWPTLRADPALIRLLSALVVVDIVYRQLYSTVPLRLRDSGHPVALYTAIIATGSALILALELPVTLLLRTRSPYPIIAGGYALVGVGFVLFGLPVTIATAVAAMIVLTAGEILYKTTATAHVLDAAPDHLVGRYQGLYTGAATSGTMLAAPIGTAIYAVAPWLLWPLCGIGCLVAAAVVRGPAARAGTPARRDGVATGG